jgi:hypothetical protein
MPAGCGVINAHPVSETPNGEAKLCYWKKKGVSADNQYELCRTGTTPSAGIFSDVTDAVGTAPYSLIEVDSTNKVFKRDDFHSGNLARLNHDHHFSGNNTHGGTNAFQSTMSFPNLTASSMLELNGSGNVVSTSGFSSSNLARINANHTISGDWTFSGENSYSDTQTHTGDIIQTTGNYDCEAGDVDIQAGFLYVTSGKMKLATATAPASASATGEAGEIRWAAAGQSYYLYLCVASDTWTRVEMSSWQ